MGPHQHQELQEEQNCSLFLLDALYCKEHWEEEEEGDYEGLDDEVENENFNCNNNGTINVCVLEQDLFWEDEELHSLFSKEHEETHHQNHDPCDSTLLASRLEAVKWVLRVNSHYAFSAITAVLAVNYLDRFITSRHFQGDKPWMTQLAAVACLSLAAKVEETQVPLLLDLQVEETKYVFEAKTIQRMELLVLSTLHWKMNPVTPLSFIDHIIRRLGLKTYLHWEFMRRCERLLLSVVLDSRFACYLPSVLATATMLHVIHRVEPCNYMEYQNQLMGVLKISKDKVDECYGLILESNLGVKEQNRKRKYRSEPGSPKGVIDGLFSCDSSNDSRASGSSVSSSPEPLFKKSTAFNRVAVDVLTSPR